MFEDQLPLDIVIIKQDVVLIAFSVLEKRGDTVVVHFFKHTHEIDGLGVYLFHLIAKSYEGTCDYINFEQDLGFDGLKQFKQSLRPIKMIIPFNKKIVRS